MKKENEALKEGYAEKSRVVEKLVKSHVDDEKVIENLLKLVEEEGEQVTELKKQITVKDEVLAKAAEEVEKVGIVCSEIVAKSEEIFQAYKKALATFGGKPLPLPLVAEGPEGVLRLYSWLLSEFEGLEEIAQTAGDNKAAVASEGLLAILRRACCVDMDRLADRSFEFPSHSELASEIGTVQGVKKAFF